MLRNFIISLPSCMGVVLQKLRNRVVRVPNTQILSVTSYRLVELLMLRNC
jgi:hypothetical protein